MNAWASVVALEEGRQVHEQIIENGCESDVFVGNSVIGMYTKCGSMDDACKVINKMPSWDVFSWNSILAGFAMHGHGNKALEHFKQTCEEGVVPDDVTFVCILLACSHAGVVDEGMRLYGSMSETYMISAKVGHYACMVDLLGRAGHLEEAENMIKGMPCKPNADVWRALLSACRIHGNVEIGEHAAQQVL
jgi:pentatricopeptide repeat protein